MQREEFVQQLWLDYVHQHPEIGALRLWPLDTPAEYLALITLDHGPWRMDTLLPGLQRMGYRPRHRYAMADRGLLAVVLSPDGPAPDSQSLNDPLPWLILGELQLGTLPRESRQQLEALAALTPQEGRDGQNLQRLLCRGRAWPMPDWATYQQLSAAHPLAGTLSVSGPRLHHVGFDCGRLGEPLARLDERLTECGLSTSDHSRGPFPVSGLVDYRFYPACSRRLPFADGDEHRIESGGLALVQKSVSTDQKRAAELLLPHHTRCEIA